MAVTYSPQVQPAMASPLQRGSVPSWVPAPGDEVTIAMPRRVGEAQPGGSAGTSLQPCRAQLPAPSAAVPTFQPRAGEAQPGGAASLLQHSRAQQPAGAMWNSDQGSREKNRGMEYYRAFQQHDSDESLPRWFCLACLAEVQQRGSMAPACPARLAHEATSPHQQAVAAGTALRLLSLPESLLLPPVVAPPMPRPGSSAQRTAAKPGRHTQIEALQQDVRASAVAASALCSAEDIVELDRYLLDRLDKGTAAQPAVPAGTHTPSQALRQDLRASAVAAAALPTDADMLIQYLLDRRGKGAPSTSSGEECSAMPHGRNAAPVLTHRCIDARLFAQLSYRIHLHHIRPALLLVSLCHECRGIPCRAGARRTRRRPRQLHLRRAGRSQALRVRMPPYAANALLGPCQHMYSITGVRQDLGL